MKHKLALIYAFYVNFLTAWLPDAPSIMRMRGVFYSFFMKGKGKNFQVSSGVVFKGLEYLEVGDNVYIAPRCCFILRVGCKIENNVLVGPGCVIVDGHHGYDDCTGYRFAKGKQGPVLIGEGSWLAANCVVTQSTVVGKNTLLGANTVASGEMCSQSVYVSQSPHVIKKVSAS
jgi:acetyltransferase-like isoleucine patch superfamily enzyme